MPTIISVKKMFLSNGMPSMSTSAVKLTSAGKSHNDNGLDAIIMIQIVGIQRAPETLGCRLRSIMKRQRIKRIQIDNASRGGMIALKFLLDEDSLNQLCC